MSLRSLMLGHRDILVGSVVAIVVAHIVFFGLREEYLSDRGVGKPNLLAEVLQVQKESMVPMLAGMIATPFAPTIRMMRDAKIDASVS
jgi:hypothetical protein